MKEKKLWLSWLPGIIGSLLLFFIGWEYNMPVMGWIAYPLLIFSFRSIPKWQHTMLFIPLMIAVKFLCIHGGWDMEVWMEIAFSVVVLIPLIAALYMDRALVKHMEPLAGTFVFPTTYIVFDFLLTYANLGMTFSLAYNQSTFIEFIQIVSLFGSWFAGFIVAWFAPVAVMFTENMTALKKVWKPLTLYFTIFAAIIMFGNLRLVLNRPQNQTVRIASITSEHNQDYWTITDNGTPKNEADFNKPGMLKTQEELFALSKKAANYGAKVIFWSEGNYPVYEDEYNAFIDRAKKFAKDNNVYFMPSCVELLYGKTKNNNLAIMINPKGEIEYRYEKTISWYPTDSDGKIPVVDTPYGRLSTAICFDMDYPKLISQARNSDIILVPGFDTRKISDFHTRVSFIRGVENGFTVIRQANKGTSIAADYLGNTLSYQKYFNTESRIMITDAPTKGVWTLYGFTGEVFLWIVCAAFTYMIFWSIKNRFKHQHGNLHKTLS